MQRAAEARQARRLSKRDEEVLGWIGEQYLAPRDVLGELLGRASDDEAARAAGRVTDTVVDRTLRRWRDLGLAQCRRFIVGEMATVWPTRTGLTVAGLGYRASEPSLATLAHRHAVARVRAALEAADPEVRWVCERELRDGTRGRLAHLPDGVLITDRARTAIEVELTPKTEERVRDILGHLFAQYDRVVYYATPRAAAVVRKASGYRLDRGTLILRPYPLVAEAPCIDQPHTAGPATAEPATAPTTPAAELEVVPPAVPAAVVVVEGDVPGPADDSHQPGPLEQHALALADAQTTALTGVEDAWRAAGHALTGIGRRHRRRR